VLSSLRPLDSDRELNVGQEEDIQTFPLVDVPDDQLDEEGKKEKRRQKLLKSNYDARMRMKAEKKAEKERVVSRVTGSKDVGWGIDSVYGSRRRKTGRTRNLE
jgi:actin-related protein